MILSLAIAVFCIFGGRFQPPAACSEQGRTRIAPPGVDRKIQVASATQRPWINLNAWRYKRDSNAPFLFDASPDRPEQALLAAAEALAFGGNLLLRCQDCTPVQSLSSWASQLPPAHYPDVADFTFVDDGSSLAAEVINLLMRRNLLFQLARPGSAPPSSTHLVVEIGHGEFTRELARNPSEFAYAVRRRLGDDHRSVRVWGSETALVRLQSNSRQSRLWVVNYSFSPLLGTRFRVRGSYSSAQAHVLGHAPAPATELKAAPQFTEFSLDEFDAIAVVDLR